MERSVSVREARKGAELVVTNGLLRVRYFLREGRWDLELEDGTPFSAQGLFARALVNGQWVATRGNRVQSWKEERLADSLGRGKRIELSFGALGSVELRKVFRIYEKRPSVFLEILLSNPGGETVRVGELRPAEAARSQGSALSLGEGLESARVFRESNNVCASVVRSIKEPGDSPSSASFSQRGEATAGGSSHRSGWLGLVYNPVSKTAFLGGFLSVDTALGKTVTRYDAGLIDEWYASCKYDGLELPPGRELRSERCYLDARRDPFVSLETFADVVAAENRLPPVGSTPALWCSWYPYRLKLTEEEVLKNAEVVAKCFRHYGVEVMQLDYGWNDRDIPGDWSHNRERFPHGLPWLVGKLEAMGLKLGLWIAPLAVFEGSDFFRSNPDSVIKDTQGRPSPWQTEWPWEPKQKIYDLDMEREESRKFIERTFRDLASAGVRYFKMDFLNGPSTAPLSFTNGIKNEDRVRDGERVRKGLAVVRNTVGTSAYLLACNLPHSHSLGIVDAVFDSMDVGNSYFDREESWQHFRRRTSGLACRYYQQKRLWHNDPDVIYVGGNPPDFSPVSSPAEARMRVTAVALSGGPVLLGDNLHKLPEERLAMYELCLPPYGRPARPVDLFTSDYPRIWDLTVETDWGAWHVVGLFNFEKEAASVPIVPSDLGLSDSRRYLVWEFWERTFLGTRQGRFEVEVPGRDARVIAIRETSNHPQLLSTTFHLSQGGVEAARVKWDSRRRTLGGECARAPGARGDLIVSVPEGFLPLSFETGGAAAGVADAATDATAIAADLMEEVAPGIWKAGLAIEGTSATWRMRFDKRR